MAECFVSSVPVPPSRLPLPLRRCGWAPAGVRPSFPSKIESCLAKRNSVGVLSLSLSSSFIGFRFSREEEKRPGQACCSCSPCSLGPGFPVISPRYRHKIVRDDLHAAQLLLKKNEMKMKRRERMIKKSKRQQEKREGRASVIRSPFSLFSVKIPRQPGVRAQSTNRGFSFVLRALILASPPSSPNLTEPRVTVKKAARPKDNTDFTSMRRAVLYEQIFLSKEETSMG